MDGRLVGRSIWTLVRPLVATGLLLLSFACSHGSTPASPVPAPSTSAVSVAHDAASPPRDATPTIKDGGRGADAAVDLAADVAERARRARERFGASARVRTVDGTFVM